MPTESRRRAALSVALGLGVVALCLYVATLTRRPSGDALGWAWIAESGSWPDRWEPHHVLLHPLAWLWFGLWRAAGLAERALLPVTALSALGAAVATGIVGGLTTALSGRTRVGLLVGAGFAVSCGPWLYAVDAEPVPVGLAAGLAALAALLLWPAARRDRPAFGWGLGLVIGLAAWVYVTHLALLPAAWVILALTPDLDRATRRRQALRLTIGALAPAALGYVAAVLATSGLSALATPSAWLPPGAGSRYGVPGLASLPHGAYAFLRTLAGYPGIHIGDSTARLWANAGGLARATFVAWYGLILLVVVAPLVVAWRRRADLPPAARLALAVLVTWAMAYAVFALLWVPGELDFWLPVSAAWWLGVGVLLGALLPAGAGWARAELAVATLVAVLAVSNALTVILPQRTSPLADDWRAATDIARHLGPKGLAIVLANPRLGAYSGYLSRGRATGEWLFRDQNGAPRPDPVGAVLARARDRGIDSLYLVGALDAPEIATALADAGLSPAELAARAQPAAWTAAGIPVWVLGP